MRTDHAVPATIAVAPTSAAAPTETATQTLSSTRWFMTTLLWATILYLPFFAGHYVMGDHGKRMAWARQLLDRSPDDPYLPPRTAADPANLKYGIGHTLLHVPVLAVSRRVTALTGRRCEGAANTFVYLLNAALLVALGAMLLRRSGLHPDEARRSALAIGFCSLWFPAMKVEYGENLVTTLLVAAWLAWQAGPFWAGMLAGMAFSVRMDAILWMLLVPVMQSDGRCRPILRWAAGVAPWAALVAWSNLIRTGSPFSAGYEPGFVNPLLHGLYGIWLSSGKSVFLYSPALLLLPSLWRPALPADDPRRRLARFALILFAAQSLLYARWWDWCGDDSWGVRFLLPAIVVAHLALATIGAFRTTAAKALLALGRLIQLPPVLIGPHSSIMLQHVRKPQMRAPWCAPRVITLEDSWFNPTYSPLVATFELLTFKLTGLRREAGDFAASPWISGFSPPLQTEEVPWDILWLHWPGAK